jgi:polyketide cyclase/dehydrase/lipid transport protein
LILGLCALVVILAAVSLALPNHLTVQRSVVINAPEPIVFPYLNNLHRFGDWSPWASRDPQLQVLFSGPEEGKGAKAEWTSGQRSVGAGSMEITGSDSNRHIDLAVNFNALEGTSYYDVAPSGSGSKVTWGFSYDTGTNPLKRWKGLLLDRYIGAEYRDGLGKLKERIESERRPTAPSASATPPMTSSTAPEQPTAATPDAAAAPAGPAPDPAQATAAPDAAAPPAAMPAPPAPAAPATKKPKRH